MEGAEIILAIAMETIQFTAVELHQQNQQLNVRHRRLAHHSYQDFQVSYQAMVRKFLKDSWEVEVVVVAAAEDSEVFLVIVLVPCKRTKIIEVVFLVKIQIQIKEVKIQTVITHAIL